MWPTVPGTTAADCAASGLPAFCAVPAGGCAVVAAATTFWLGALAEAWAAAGVSPAAAKAIAHPNSLIETPDSGERPDAGAPDLRGSIGAAFQSLKRDFGQVLMGVAISPNGPRR